MQSKDCTAHSSHLIYLTIPFSDAAHLGDPEIYAMRIMFLLLAVSMVGHSSGQFLASGAVRLEDLSIIGAQHTHIYKCTRISIVHQFLFLFIAHLPRVLYL